jgi:hypothetical protein
VVDNQHEKIKGYRDLSEEEIKLMNEVKSLAERVGHLVDNVLANKGSIDQHWLAIGRTDLQKGFMSVVRSIAQPDSF